MTSSARASSAELRLNSGGTLKSGDAMIGDDVKVTLEIITAK
jgi:hypothetical protein